MNEPEVDNQNYSTPPDFPRADIAGAVSGIQPKILLTEYKGRLYPSGDTPPERYQRWFMCEDLAQHLCVKSRESKAGKRSHMTEGEILDQYLERMLKQPDWGSPREMQWTIRRAAVLLGWPHPISADESS